MSDTDFPPLTIHHPALQALEQLQASGAITVTRFVSYLRFLTSFSNQELASKFTKFYDVLLRMMENDSSLLRKAQALNQNNDGILRSLTFFNRSTLCNRENEESERELSKRIKEIMDIKDQVSVLLAEKGKAEVRFALACALHPF